MRWPSIRLAALGRVGVSAVCVLAIAAHAHAAVFTVNSTGDAADTVPGDARCEISGGTGACTLRAAIQESNATAGADFIQFAIGSGVQTIRPATALPDIVDPVEIDATTQPGFAGTPIIEISGPRNSLIDGLTITGGRTTIRGLVISGFGQGIRITGLGENTIAGNFIGTDVTGTVARFNNSDGIAVYTSNNTIGGVTEGARNVISGNGTGLCLCSANATGNVVRGNFVGTDVTGTKKIGNGSIFYEIPFAGIAVYSARSNTIGGAGAAARNVISGNIGVGVQLLNAGQNVVEGNFIGVDVTGNAPLGNHLDGVAIGSGGGNIIGGTSPEGANVISGNGGHGVSIFVDGRGGDTAEGHRVRANYIGVSAGVDALIGNGGAGVHISAIGGPYRASRNIVARNVIGGNAAAGVHIMGAGATENPVLFNAIAYNDSAGVTIVADASANAILANAIFGNGALGIDLGGDGVTTNDPGDADAGANRRQNFPVLTSARLSGFNLLINGTLESTPSTAFQVEFSASSACDPAGHGEGARSVGLIVVETDASGTARFSAATANTVPAGWYVAATATDPAGNSSEFARCVVVDPS